MHGLRHQYAQTRYEELTGWKNPKAGGFAWDTLRGEGRGNRPDSTADDLEGAWALSNRDRDHID